jgi:hypothetical protein
MRLEVELRFAASDYPESLCRGRRFQQAFERLADRIAEQGVEASVLPCRVPRLVERPKGPPRIDLARLGSEPAE